MSVVINSTDYSTFVDSVAVSGGTPIYEYVPVWNGRRKRAVTGYNEWVVTISILYDTEINDLIDEITDVEKEYTIVIGDNASVERTFSNMHIMSFDDSVLATDNLQMLHIQFIGEGLPSNKT